MEDEHVQDQAALHHEQRVEDGERCLESALFYLSLGWSVLALCPPDHAGVGKEHLKTCKSKGKRPLGTWKEFQDRLPTETELRYQWNRNPGANVGIALGPTSGLIRIDVEGENGEKALQEKSNGDLPATLEFTSGRQDGTGRGLLYRIPAGANLRTTSEDHGKKQEIRFQARGAQTVLPPSRHESGSLYAWKKGHGPGEREPAIAPDWLVAELSAKSTFSVNGNGKHTPRFALDDIIGGVKEGRRNDAAASFIGKLLSSVKDLKNTSAMELQWQITLMWNNQNDPPIPIDELRTTFVSVTKLESLRRDKLDQDNLDAYYKSEVAAAIETAKAETPISLNGETNGHPVIKSTTEKPSWHLVIIESDPKEFRLRMPPWADSDRLVDGYVILNESQIRCWANGSNGIPQAVYSQALITTDPVYKGWAKPGGPLDMLTREATIVEVAPENKKSLYMLGFFFRYLRNAKPCKDDNGLTTWPVNGRPTTSEDGAVCFKLDNLKKAISHNKEDFGVRTLTRLLEEYGVKQDKIDGTRWWIVPPDVLNRIGEVTLERL